MGMGTPLAPWGHSQHPGDTLTLLGAQGQEWGHPRPSWGQPDPSTYHVPAHQLLISGFRGLCGKRGSAEVGDSPQPPPREGQGTLRDRQGGVSSSPRDPSPSSSGSMSSGSTSSCSTKSSSAGMGTPLSIPWDPSVSPGTPLPSGTPPGGGKGSPGRGDLGFWVPHLPLPRCRPHAPAPAPTAAPGGRNSSEPPLSTPRAWEGGAGAPQPPQFSPTHPPGVELPVRCHPLLEVPPVQHLQVCRGERGFGEIPLRSPEQNPAPQSRTRPPKGETAPQAHQALPRVPLPRFGVPFPFAGAVLGCPSSPSCPTAGPSP